MPVLIEEGGSAPEVAATLTLGKYKAEVWFDYYGWESCNPLQDDTLGMVVGNRDEVGDYDLGHKQEPMANGLTQTCPVCDGDCTDDAGEWCQECDGQGELDVAPFDYFHNEYGATVVIPMEFRDYGSGGERLHIGSPMKPGEEMGRENLYLFDTPERRKVCGCEDWTVERLAESLQDEAEDYRKYIEGECFYVVAMEGDEVLDMEHGFLGEQSAVDSVKAVIQGYYEADRREHERALEWAREMGRTMPDVWMTTGVPA